MRQNPRALSSLRKGTNMLQSAPMVRSIAPCRSTPCRTGIRLAQLSMAWSRAPKAIREAHKRHKRLLSLSRRKRSRSRKAKAVQVQEQAPVEQVQEQAPVEQVQAPKPAKTRKAQKAVQVQEQAPVEQAPKPAKTKQAKAVQVASEATGASAQAVQVAHNAPADVQGALVDAISALSVGVRALSHLVTMQDD